MNEAGLVGSLVRRLKWWARPRVLDAQRPDQVWFEGPERTSQLQSAQRTCVLAHWNATGRVSRSTSNLINELGEVGFEVLLVSTSEAQGPLTWVEGRPSQVTVVRRPNLGFDFGSWATALELIPELLAGHKLLLVNSSLVGPFASIAPIMKHFLASEADIWGITSSTEFAPHVQSYALGFTGGVLTRPRFRRFWKTIRAHDAIWDVVLQYELGLSALASRLELTVEVVFPSDEFLEQSVNPTFYAWEELLDAGFPFVKRSFLLSQEQAMRNQVEAAVQKRFGVDIEDWL